VGTREPACPTRLEAAIRNLSGFAFVAVGSTEPRCPHCGVGLPKMPQARSKCPSCKSVIRLKHRNIDRELVIVNDQDEARLLEEGLYKDAIRDIGAESATVYDSVFSEIERVRGRHPSHHEVLSMTLSELERSARDRGDHGIARSHRYRLSVAHARIGDSEEALRLVCQCCYLDMCGPENSVQAGASAFSPWRRVGTKWRRTVRFAFGDRESVTDHSPFFDGLLGDLDDYRKSLRVPSDELQRCAEIEAACLADYTKRAVEPASFGADLMHELRRFRRRPGS
jgi:hypothetical protein